MVHQTGNHHIQIKFINLDYFSAKKFGILVLRLVHKQAVHSGIMLSACTLNTDQIAVTVTVVRGRALNQTLGDYITNAIDYNYLPHARLQINKTAI